MAWENGYYYRKKWQNGTCVSEYVGSGIIASLAADLDKIERDRQELARLEWQAHIEEQNVIDRQIEEVGRQAREITRAVLLATGHYQHKGTWRKRRMSELTTEEKAKKATELLTRLQNGHGTSQDEKAFSQMLKDVPRAWVLYGDLHRSAVNGAISEITGKAKDQFVLGESLKVGMKQLATEQGYDTASPLEKLLIDHFILTWLRLYWIENLFNQAQKFRAISNEQIEHWEKRLSTSQRRFLRAAEALARVRRLASRTPEILQVNIAQQQVNQVAGSG